MSSRLTVERYEPAAKEAWDRLVSGARARHFIFERAYMDYHANRYADVSLLVMRGERPLAALPASRHGADVVSHGGLTFGGLLSGPGLTTAVAVAAIDAIATSLRGLGARRLVYKAVPHLYHVAPAEEDLFALHAAGAKLVGRDVTAAIPVGARLAYSAERRRAVARGRGAGLDIAESDRVEEFMSLVETVLAARHGVQPVHTAGEMRLLADRFPGRIRLFIVTDTDELVAGVLIFETPTVAHAQYIASSPRGRELGAGDALFDHLIHVVYQDRWFDFGISNARDGTLNAGLMRNKEGFGARAIVHDRYLLALV